MAEKPTAAFVLSLIGGIFILLGGVVITAVSSILLFFPVAGAVVAAIGIFGLICGILTILGAIWINTGEKDKVRMGSILVLIFSILSWIGAGGGFFIGFILGLIGAILGLTWNPPATEQPPPPPPS
jgi:hypothetical protein